MRDEKPVFGHDLYSGVVGQYKFKGRLIDMRRSNAGTRDPRLYGVSVLEPRKGAWYQAPRLLPHQHHLPRLHALPIYLQPDHVYATGDLLVPVILSVPCGRMGARADRSIH